MDDHFSFSANSHYIDHCAGNINKDLYPKEQDFHTIQLDAKVNVSINTIIV